MGYTQMFYVTLMNISAISIQRKLSAIGSKRFAILSSYSNISVDLQEIDSSIFGRGSLEVSSLPDPECSMSSVQSRKLTKRHIE